MQSKKSTNILSNPLFPLPMSTTGELESATLLT